MMIVVRYAHVNVTLVERDCHYKQGCHTEIAKRIWCSVTSRLIALPFRLTTYTLRFLWFQKLYRTSLRIHVRTNQSGETQLLLMSGAVKPLGKYCLSKQFMQKETIIFSLSIDELSWRSKFTTFLLRITLINHQMMIRKSPLSTTHPFAKWRKSQLVSCTMDVYANYGLRSQLYVFSRVTTKCAIR